MKICIHRGTQEIGGTCIEIEQNGTRIVLDLGLPLDADEADDPQDLLPPVKGFLEKDESLLALLLSHPHQDHYGLVRHLKTNVPLAMGQAAQRILETASLFSPTDASFRTSFHLEDKSLLSLGPFKITPLLVDHSAYDAYALLVEAGEKQIFYSGDFRGHGRKSYLFKNLINSPPSSIDALLIEGTVLGREGKKEPATEDDLVWEFQKNFNQTKGLCLVWTSSQNIDRIVTIFKACKKSGRQLIFDLYTAEVLRATGNKNVPQGTWNEIRVFLPEYQRKDAKRKGLFEEVHRYRANRIFPENLAEEISNSVLIFRPKMAGDLEKAGCLGGASLVYSLWEGYLNMDNQRPFREWLERNQIPLFKIHTSGHASEGDLRQFAEAINPKVLVPIHSYYPEGFNKIFPRLEFKKDGEWWGIT